MPSTAPSPKTKTKTHTRPVLPPGLAAGQRPPDLRPGMRVRVYNTDPDFWLFRSRKQIWSEAHRMLAYVTGTVRLVQKRQVLLAEIAELPADYVDADELARGSSTEGPGTTWFPYERVAIVAAGEPAPHPAPVPVTRISDQAYAAISNILRYARRALSDTDYPVLLAALRNVVDHPENSAPPITEPPQTRPTGTPQGQPPPTPPPPPDPPPPPPARRLHGPLRSIISTGGSRDDGTYYEILSCGHRLDMAACPKIQKLANHRRCHVCAREAAER